MANFEQFDVVVVPFPYTDKSTSRRRPALVISDSTGFGSKIGQSVMAMITSARHSAWPLDVEIEDLDSAGLPAPSIVRMKLFTLDHRMVIRACGALGPQDRQRVQTALSSLIPGP